MRFALSSMSIDIQNTKYRIIYWCIAISLTAGIFFVYANNLYWDEPKVGLYESLNGTAHKPFIYRILVPALVKLVGLFLPFLDPKTIASAIMYLSLLGFIISMKYLSLAFWKPSISIDLMILLSPIVMTPLMFVANHIYDFSILFLFTLELAALARGRVKSYLLLYPFTCLAKETALLLPIVFVLKFYLNTNRRLFYKLLSLQLIMWGSIRLILYWIFRENSGGMIEFHLTEWIFAVSTAPILMFIIYIGFGLFIGGLVVHNWSNKPLLLRQAALVIIPVLSTLHLFFGIPLELRVFYEAYPVIYLLSTYSLCNMLGTELELTTQQ